jgi:hypothetical protein
MGLHSTRSAATGAAPTLVVVIKTVVSKLLIYFLSPLLWTNIASICDRVNLQRLKHLHLCSSWHVCVESVSVD